MTDKTRAEISAEEGAKQIQNSLEDANKRVLIAEEMLALVLNETGPVEIDRKSRKALPADVQIAVDVNHETETVTISLVTP